MNTDALEAAQMEFASKRTIEAALKVAKIANEMYKNNGTHTDAHESARALQNLIIALDNENEKIKNSSDPVSCWVFPNWGVWPNN